MSFRRPKPPPPSTLPDVRLALLAQTLFMILTLSSLPGPPDSTHACCVAGWHGVVRAACAAADTAIALLADCRH